MSGAGWGGRKHNRKGVDGMFEKGVESTPAVWGSSIRIYLLAKDGNCPLESSDTVHGTELGYPWWPWYSSIHAIQSLPGIEYGDWHTSVMPLEGRISLFSSLLSKIYTFLSRVSLCHSLPCVKVPLFSWHSPFILPPLGEKWLSLVSFPWL